MDSRSNEEPERSRGPFSHNVSTHPAGIIQCDENTIRDADGCTLIRQWYGSLGHGEYVDFVALAPGDWPLFAAAPEMLQTLKLFYDWSKNVTKYPPYWVQTTFVDKCSEIIAKAEGRQP